MATDLFSQYFDNPKKSVIYTDITCNNGQSGDEISFDIVDSDGVISDNNNTLSKVDLSDVHVTLTEYSNDMKVINPYSFIYVKGTTDGDSYMSKSYGYIDASYDASILEDNDWEVNSSITFVIKYLDVYGQQCIKFIKADGSAYIEDASTFTQACQKTFDENSIPINVELIQDGTVNRKKYYLQFTGTQVGYEFNIQHIVIWHYDGIAYDRATAVREILKKAIEKSPFGLGFNDEWIDSHVPAELRGDLAYCINVYTGLLAHKDYQRIYSYLEVLNGYITVDTTEYPNMHTDFLLEDISKYIPAYKYRNGAFKGFVIKAVYPKYNADIITEPMRSLKIAYLKDRVEEYNTTLYNQYTGVPLYIKTIREVSDAYYCDQDIIGYNKWVRSHFNTADQWISFDEIPHMNVDSDWNPSTVPDNTVMTSAYEDAMLYDVMGLYGYCTYLTRHNLWSTFGQLYARTAVEDDEGSNTVNLIPSFIIYNPNAFPVEVNYLTFV